MLKQVLLGLALAGTTKTDNCVGSTEQTATSGVTVASVAVPKQSNGLTVEQQNVRDRLVLDNKPGAIKHLYVISAFSGDVLLYSTVRGKVTSSGKRLAPLTVIANGHEGYRAGFTVPTLGDNATAEVLQDDGTYGASIDYLYWWDAKGVYHQHYVAGGQIVHVSDQPLRVAKVLINLSPATP